MQGLVIVLVWVSALWAGWTHGVRAAIFLPSPDASGFAERAPTDLESRLHGARLGFESLRRALEEFSTGPSRS